MYDYQTTDPYSYKPYKDEEDQSVDIKSFLFRFLSYWYLFVLCVFVALAMAFIYTKFKSPVYQGHGTILIKEGKSGMDPTSIMAGLGYGNQQNLQNEIGILKSYSLSERVVRKLDLEVLYYDKSGFKAVEMYKSSPFVVEFEKNIPQAVGLAYNIQIHNADNYTLSAEGKDLSTFDYSNNSFVGQRMGKVNLKGEYKIGEWVDNGYNKFRIVLNDRYHPDSSRDKKMSFCFYDYLSLTRSMRSFSVSPIDKDASIAVVTMAGSNRQKLVDFLNTLMQEYVSRGLEKKNLVSENTINFIDKQLLEVQDSLSQAEIDLQDFRRNNDLVDMDAQAKQVYDYVKTLEKQRAEIAVNSKYYKRLQSYISDHLNDPENLVAPSAMGIQDPLLNQLVSDLVKLSREKSTQLLTSTEAHPAIIMIDEQIMNTKKALFENINNLVSNAEMSLDDIDQRIARADKESKNLPQIQRLLLGYQRKFSYSDETYNYLMQRRSEAQILKASNTADNEIIDLTSVAQTSKVAPNVKKVFLIAIFLGLFFPALYILLKDFFNVKIMDRKDVEKLTKYPIIGQIALSADTNPLVVVDSPKSPIAESFRSVRTNIEFIVQGKAHSTILITGGMPNIGKTFISMNVASIYALYGKKTVLLGFDLRKPKIFGEFELANRVGLSSFLSNKSSIDEVIQPSGKIPSLDIIPSGPIPPNPAELIASEKCVELFKLLNERYDYIIIDTPPLGLVTDAFLLMKFSDANLFIVRQEYTVKNVFAGIIKDLEDRNIPMNIVINGIRMDGSYGYHNSYGYGRYGYGRYGYGKYGNYTEGYYSEDNNTSEKKKKHGRFGIYRNKQQNS